MLAVAGGVTYLGYAVYQHSPTIDTSVDAFIVRGTLLSNRRRASGAVRRFLQHTHYFPYDREAEAEWGFCRSHTRDMHILVSDVTEENNIISNNGLRRICSIIEEMQATPEWQEHCGRKVHSQHRSTGRSCEERPCTPPTYLLSLPQTLYDFGGGSSYTVLSLLHFLKRSENLLFASDTLKQVCKETGTVPFEFREAINCDATCTGDPTCEVPCEVGDVDVCKLLITTDASPQELKALARFPTSMPSHCNFTDEYVVHVQRATQVFAAWAKRSAIASKRLPQSGGRGLFEKQATEDAANREVALGEMKSKTTRVILSMKTRPPINTGHVDRSDTSFAFTGIEWVAQFWEGKQAKYDVSISWREWGYFNEEMVDQLWKDSWYAIGSACFVLLVIIAFSRDVLLSLGALVGVLLCLPLALSLYVFLFKIEWVGVLHVIGLFLVAGIGADDFFVLLAHWRDEKRRNPQGAQLSRLWSAMTHSLHTVAATSVTTAGAFLGNFASHIAPIQLFGVFMAVLVLSLLLIVVVWFPALFVATETFNEWIASCCCPSERRTERESSDLLHDSTEMASLGESETPSPSPTSHTDSEVARCTTLSNIPNRALHNVVEGICRHHRAIAGVCLLIFLASFTLALNLEGPNGEISLWPDDHNEARYMNTELTLDTDIGRATLRLTWGLLPADTGDLLDPTSETDIRYDTTFDVSLPAVQQHLYNVCQDLYNPELPIAAMIRTDAVKCPMLSLVEYLESRNISFPVEDPVLFERVLSDWYPEMGFSGFYWKRNEATHRPVAFTVEIGSTVDWRESYSKLRPKFDVWEAWMEEKNQEAPPQANKGFHDAGGLAWMVMETQKESQRTAFTSLLISLAVALLMLLLVTRNVIISFTATACIAASVVTFVGFMTLAGWNLGILESICMTIVVGVSCDYVFHVTVLHAASLRERSADVSEEEHSVRRMRECLTLMGPPVLAAAATSIGSAAFLTGCVVLFLYKFGAFMVVTLTSAALYAFVFYPALILTYSSLGFSLTTLSWEWPLWRKKKGDLLDGEEEEEEEEEEGEREDIN